MRLPTLSLLLISAVLLGEMHAASAQSPTSYPWCSRGGDGRLVAFENAPGITANLVRNIAEAGAIAHQAAGQGEFWLDCDAERVRLPICSL